MKSTRYPWAIALFTFILALILATPALLPGLLAQTPNPTPPVVYLTPTVNATETPTAVPSATPDSGGVQPDAFEPNDTPETATPVSWGMVPATLHQGDVDYYALYLKTGQIVNLHTRSPHNLDTYLQVWQGAQLLAENDDSTATDLGSAVLFTVPADGWYIARVSPGGIASGSYELHVGLTDPTPTMTPSPTVTSSPTPTPSPTLTPTPTTPPTITPPFMGAGGTAGAASHPIAPVTAGLVAAALTTTPTLTTTAVLTTTISLHLLGPAQPAATPQVTTARVLIYYDANNNRQTDPGEGVPNVSVLAVDSQGQRLVRSFTNLQGEALFTLTNAPFERVATPFVSAWSARVRPGMVNEPISLGLPAVRLPVFLPVSQSESES
ncbi:MAG: PPC domain-containing protein [Chloroflexi bacterium]|nr:PPC domain-containing protein [Chloroflexota bacterium]